jgi:hypothetical protein
MIVYSNALAWTLLHFIWQAIAIAAMYKYVARRCEASSASTQYNLALAALLCIAVVFLLTAVYEFARLAYFSAESSLAVLTIQPFSGREEQEVVLRLTGGRLHIFQWIDALWLTGCLSLLFRSIGGQWIHYRTHRSGYFLDTGELYERFAATLRRSIRGPVVERTIAVGISPGRYVVWKARRRRELSVQFNLVWKLENP